MMQQSNGTTEAPQVITPLMEDYERLIAANPQLKLPLANIVQQRMLAEKDAEIAELKASAVAVE